MVLSVRFWILVWGWEVVEDEGVGLLGDGVDLGDGEDEDEAWEVVWLDWVERAVGVR